MQTLNDIHDQIARVSQDLYRMVKDIQALADAAATCETTFKVEFAKARLRARADADAAGKKITVDQVEDIATVATTGARLGYLLAANNLTVAREALRARQSILDGLRTQAASWRNATSG